VILITLPYRNCRIYTIANPIRISHNNTINPTNSLSLGDRFFRPVSFFGSFVSMVGSGVGVTVFIGVGVAAGNINVIAGNGISVVVGVLEGVVVGV
jgi:hypothetical protein